MSLTDVRTCGHVIGGEVVASLDGGTFESINPHDNSLNAHVALGTRNDVARAVAAARSAFPAWSKALPAERARLLRRLADLLEDHADELATLDTLDMGKPL